MPDPLDDFLDRKLGGGTATADPLDSFLDRKLGKKSGGIGKAFTHGALQTTAGTVEGAAIAGGEAVSVGAGIKDVVTGGLLSTVGRRLDSVGIRTPFDEAGGKLFMRGVERSEQMEPVMRAITQTGMEMGGHVRAVAEGLGYQRSPGAMGIAEDVAGALPQLVGAAGAGAAGTALGGPLAGMATAAGFFAATDAGNQTSAMYRRMVAEGVPEDEAAYRATKAGAVYGVASGALEFAGIGTVLRGTKLLRALERSSLILATAGTVGAGVGEGLTEAAQGVLGDASLAWAREDWGEFKRTWNDLDTRGREFLVGAILGTAVRGGVEALNPENYRSADEMLADIETMAEPAAQPQTPATSGEGVPGAVQTPATEGTASVPASPSSGSGATPGSPTASSGEGGTASPQPTPTVTIRLRGVGAPQPDTKLADGTPMFRDRGQADAYATFKNERQIPGDTPVRVLETLRGAEEPFYAVVPDERMAEARARGERQTAELEEFTRQAQRSSPRSEPPRPTAPADQLPAPITESAPQVPVSELEPGPSRPEVQQPQGPSKPVRPATSDAAPATPDAASTPVEQMTRPQLLAEADRLGVVVGVRSLPMLRRRVREAREKVQVNEAVPQVDAQVAPVATPTPQEPPNEVPTPQAAEEAEAEREVEQRTEKKGDAITRKLRKRVADMWVRDYPEDPSLRGVPNKDLLARQKQHPQYVNDMTDAQKAESAAIVLEFQRRNIERQELAKKPMPDPVPGADRPYYIFNYEDDEFQIADGAKSVKMDADPEGDYFISKGDGGKLAGWVVTEGRSGAAITPRHKSRPAAIKAAQEMLERHKDHLGDAIKRAIKKSGIAPRYAATPKPSRSSKLREAADKLESDARAANAKLNIPRGRNIGATLPPAYYANLVKIGAAKILKGVAKFAEWASEMVSSEGKWIEAALNDLWADSQSLAEDIEAGTEADNPTTERVTQRVNARKQADERSTSARKDDMAEDREALGLDALDSPARRSWQEALDAAERKGLDEIHRALQLGAEVINAPRPFSDIETAGLVKAAAKLKNDHRAIVDRINAERDPVTKGSLVAQMNHAEQQFDVLSRALRKSGTEKGRALASQKLTLDADMSLIAVKARAAAVKGSALTTEESKRFEDLTARLDAANARADELEAKLNTQVAQKAVREHAAKVRTKPTISREATFAAKLARARELLEMGCK